MSTNDEPPSPPPPEAPSPPEPEPKRPSDRPLTQADATDVLNLALERLNEAHRSTNEILLDAIDRLKRESEGASELARALSVPPKEGDDEE